MRKTPIGAVRALDSLPAMLSESAVEQALRDGLPRRLPAQARKEALAVAFAAAVQSESDLGSGADLFEREIRLETAALAPLVGLRPKSVDAAFAHLSRAGVWEILESRGERRARFLPDMCERSATWGELDWRSILEALRGDFGAIALARAYARILPPPLSGWTAVSNAEVGSHAELGRDAVRRARSVLEEAGILEARKSAGMSDEVRFTPFARGMAPTPPASPSAGARAERVPSSPPSAVSPSGPAAAPPPAAIPGGGLEVQIGGVSIAIPAGTQGWVEEMPGGGSRLHLGALTIESGPDGGQIACFAGVPLTPR